MGREDTKNSCGNEDIESSISKLLRLMELEISMIETISEVNKLGQQLLDDDL